jgi:hypothetical protein
LRCALCSLNQFHRTCCELHARLSNYPDRRELLEVFAHTDSWLGTNHDADRLRDLEKSIHRASLEMQSLQRGGSSGGSLRGVGSSELEQFVIATALQNFDQLSRHLGTSYPSLQAQRQLHEKRESAARAKAAAVAADAELAAEEQAATATAEKVSQEREQERWLAAQAAEQERSEAMDAARAGPEPEPE